MSNINSTLLDNPRKDRKQGEPAASESTSIIKRNISYPKANDVITRPTMWEMNNTIQKYRDVDTGAIMELDPFNSRLLTNLSNMRAQSIRNGEPPVYTLDAIIRQDNGRGTDKEPSDDERNMYKTAFTAFAFPIKLMKNDGSSIITHFVDIDILENAEINGQLTNAYHIKNVITIPKTQRIFYYQLRLPPGLPITNENIHIQNIVLELIGKARPRIDFEQLCKDLNVTTARARTTLYRKLEKMIKYYDIPNVIVSRMHYKEQKDEIINLKA